MCKNISCGNLISRRTTCVVIQSSLGEIYATAWVVLVRVRETNFMGLCREMFYRSFWVEGKLPNQAKEFIHLRMVFLRVMGRWSMIRTGEIAAALTRLLHQTVLVKRELRQKAKAFDLLDLHFHLRSWPWALGSVQTKEIHRVTWPGPSLEMDEELKQRFQRTFCQWNFWCQLVSLVKISYYELTKLC